MRRRWSRGAIALWWGVATTLTVALLWTQTPVRRSLTLVRVHQDIRVPVLAATLRRDWWAAAYGLRDVTPRTPSPVRRLLKAQLCLELNQAKEAAQLGATASGADTAAWTRWTARLADALPDDPVAFYLLADALARSGQWRTAEAASARAVALAPTWVAARVERGVIRANNGDTNQAILDLDWSARHRPTLADAWTSSGALCIQQNSAPEAAIAAFDHALRLAPDSPLALNGRGAARIVTRDLEGARTDLTRAARLARDMPLIEQCVQHNLKRLLRAHDQATRQALAMVIGRDPGTDINRTLEGIKDQQSAAQMMGILQNSINFNRGITSVVPDLMKVDASLSTTKEASGSFGAEWDSRNHTIDNLAWQQKNLDTLLNRFPDVKPVPMSPLSSFFQSRGGDAYDLTHPNPGGARSRDIQYAPVESGEWDVVTRYSVGNLEVGGKSKPGTSRPAGQTKSAHSPDKEKRS